MATERNPGSKEAEAGDKGKVRRTGTAPRAAGWRRLRVVYDVDGPHVRLGVGWFVLEVAALLGGVGTIALLYSATAAIAPFKTAKTWLHRPNPAQRVTAAAGAAVIGMAGALTTGLVGAAILGTVAAALIVAFSERLRRPRVDPILNASITVRSALFPGFAAACVVIAARFEFGSVVGLVLVVGAYETGDYLVGSGADNPVEGPIAGAAAILVTTFAI